MRGAPHRFAVAIRPNERANFGIEGGTATLGPVAPSPVPAESRPMPLDDRGRLDDDQRVAPARSGTREQHPEPAVDIGQPGSFDGPLDDPELVAEGKDLDRQLAPRPEQGECREEQGADDVQHGSAAWSGGDQTSTITHWYGFSGGTSTHGPAEPC